MSRTVIPYSKAFRQPDTSQQGVGLVDWVGAVQRGAAISVAVDNAKSQQSQMAVETNGLLMKNALDDMTLKEQAVHHGAMMKHLKSDRYSAMLENTFASEAAQIKTTRMKTERLYDQMAMEERNLADYKEVRESGLMGLAANALATKDPANAYGAYLTLEKLKPGSMHPEILNAKAQLKEIFTPSVEGMAAQANEAEASDPGSFELTLGQTAQDFASNARPEFSGIISESLGGDVQRKNGQMQQQRARQFEKAKDGYIQTGMSDEQATRAVLNDRRMSGLNLANDEAMEESNARYMKLQRGEYENKLSFMEGLQEGGKIDQTELGLEIGLLGRARDEQNLRFSKRRLELQQRHHDITHNGIPEQIGGSSLSQLTKARMWGTPSFSASPVQDAFMVEIDSYLQQIDNTIDKVGIGKAKKEIEAKQRLTDLRKELGWGGRFFHIQKFKDTTDPVVKAILKVHQTSHGVNADELEATEALEGALIEFRKIYTPKGTESERIQYELAAMDNLEAVTQGHLDYLSNFRINGSAPSQQEIVEP